MAPLFGTTPASPGAYQKPTAQIGVPATQATISDLINNPSKFKSLKQEEPYMTQLAAHIRHVFSTNIDAKVLTLGEMRDAKERYLSKYSATKLAEIESVGGTKIYMGITKTKCINAMAWLKDILFQPADKPWAVVPTPAPDIPEEYKVELFNKLYNTVYNTMFQKLQAEGVPYDPIRLRQAMEEFMPKIYLETEKKLLEEIDSEAAQKMHFVEKIIDDKLEEGGFKKAIMDAIFDFVVYGVMIIKGPIVRRKKMMRRVTGIDGNISIVAKTDNYTCFNRVSPLNFYPSPSQEDINDDDTIEKISMKPKQLMALIGIDGYNEEAIKGILRDYQHGKLREWLVDAARLVEKPFSTEFLTSHDIDVLEYWGSVKGSILLEWGMKKTIIQDPDAYYDISAWLIGTTVIGAMLNPDPMGDKPYSKTTYTPSPGTFWGFGGIPSLVSAPQDNANATARAIVNNTAISSGPQVERNINRLAPGETKNIYPWKIWDTTDQLMSTAAAIRFYQPKSVVSELMAIYNFWSKVADEHSGIPAYAHGDPSVGGAGNTAAGLSMLMSGSSKSHGQVVKQCDTVVESIITKVFYDILPTLPPHKVPDLKVVARGSSVMIAKEQMAIRKKEFIVATNNPVDNQIIGLDGRKYMLEEAARSANFDIQKLFKSPNPEPINPNPGIPPTESQEVDEGGNPIKGTDNKVTE